MRLCNIIAFDMGCFGICFSLELLTYLNIVEVSRNKLFHICLHWQFCFHPDKETSCNEYYKYFNYGGFFYKNFFAKKIDWDDKK